MRNDTDNFSAENRKLNKEPRYYIEISYDIANTDLYYFTSDSDVALPSTATAANTFHNTVSNVQGTTQRLDTINAISSIGGGEFTLTDLNGTVSELMRDKWLIEEALRGKRVRTYFGYKGLENADYTIVATQEKFDHAFDGINYTFFTEDAQGKIKKDIFKLNKTNLSQSISIDQIAIPAQKTSLFEMNWHDVNHTDSPNATVGYFSIKPDERKEIIKYTATVTTAILVTGTDISFTAADNSINATSTDLSVFSPGQLINIDATASNDSNVIVNTVTSTKVTTFSLSGGAGAIVDESAGSTFAVNAPVQFYNCTRGSLNTRAQEYEVDTSISVDRRQELNEHVYMETTLPKIIYAILTGVWYGTANTTPSGWDLGIATSLINSASFIDKLDLYNTSDESGKIFRFSGEKEQDAKEFISEQCALPMACFLRVLNDGTTALRRATKVLSDASYVRHLTADDILSVGSIFHNDKDVHNEYTVAWNYEDEKEATTRIHALGDAASVAKQGLAESIDFEFRGLHGSIHTLDTVYDTFNMLNDRYAGPPKLWSVKVLQRHNDLEIGEVIRVTLENVLESTNRDVDYMDRSWEIQGKDVDWVTGDVTLHLFGSTEKATPLSSTESATVLSNDFYATAGGRLAATKLDNVGLTTTNTAGHLHITADGTLTGEASVTESSTFWWDGDLTIDSGVTLDWTKNIHFYVMGTFTYTDNFGSKGQGQTTGASSAGNTKSGGSLHFDWNDGKGPFGNNLHNGTRSTINSTHPGSTLTGVYDSIPYIAVKVNEAGTSVAGLPGIYTGSASPLGRDTTYQDVTSTGTLTGGSSASGGAGCVVICRGVAAGASGKINTSGADGVAGGDSSPTSGSGSNSSLRAGNSGGGAPGFVTIFLDGADAISSLSDSNFIQNYGDVTLNGSPINEPVLAINLNDTGPFYSNDLPTGGQSVNQSFWRVQYIPGNALPVEDESPLTDKGTAIAFAETENSPPTAAQDLSTIQVTITTPSATNYQYSNVYYKLTTQPDSEYLFVGPALDSVNLPFTTMNGLTYDVIAKPVSKKGVESTEFVHSTFTVANQKGGAVLATGNYIAVGQTAFDTGLGCWIEKTASGVKASFGNSAGDKVVIDNDAVNIVDITGKITADAGVIGGWTIGATSIISGSGSSTVGLESSDIWRIYAGGSTASSAPFRVKSNGAMVCEAGTIGGWTVTPTLITDATARVRIDSANAHIRVRNAAGTSHVTMDETGITGVDSTLGTTFKIYTDGTAPEFSSGIITSTIYNISTSGILRTSATVGDGSASSAGVLLNDTGIKCFEANSSTPSFFADASDGSTTMGNVTDEVYAKFDQSTNTFKIGRDTKFLGADAYSNDNIYFAKFMGDTNYADISTGSGALTNFALETEVKVTATTDLAGGHVSSSNQFGTHTWDSSRRFKASIKLPTSTSAVNFYLGIGNTAIGGVSNACMFLFKNDGNYYGISRGGSAETLSSSYGTYTASASIDIEIVFVSSTSVKFYVDGVLKGTITTNLPSGVTNSQFFASWDMKSTASGTYTATIGEYKFNQDP